MTTPITFTHLRFDCRAINEVILGGQRAGNDLRNALVNIIRYATCPEAHNRAKPTPEHTANCPACWLLAAENNPGSDVRPYAFVPPQPARDRVGAGQPFSFGLTLFGEGMRFLPYFVLAAAEMGKFGVGPSRRERLGRFKLEAIESANPFTGECNYLLQPGESFVRSAAVTTAFSHAAQRADILSGPVRTSGNLLRLNFLSPLRLHGDGRLSKIPDFPTLFKRLLFRIDELGRQLAGGARRDRDEVVWLNQLADRVRLVENRTSWVEQWSWSDRKNDRTPIGGLVGTATYKTDDWASLLPWLLFGQGTQVGKSVVKGDGVYEVVDRSPGYWAWLAGASATKAMP